MVRKGWTDCAFRSYRGQKKGEEKCALSSEKNEGKKTKPLGKEKGSWGVHMKGRGAERYYGASQKGGVGTCGGESRKAEETKHWASKGASKLSGKKRAIRNRGTSNRNDLEGQRKTELLWRKGKFPGIQGDTQKGLRRTGGLLENRERNQPKGSG